MQYSNEFVAEYQNSITSHILTQSVSLGDNKKREQLCHFCHLSHNQFHASPATSLILGTYTHTFLGPVIIVIINITTIIIIIIINDTTIVTKMWLLQLLSALSFSRLTFVIIIIVIVTIFNCPVDQNINPV